MKAFVLSTVLAALAIGAAAAPTATDLEKRICFSPEEYSCGGKGEPSCCAKCSPTGICPLGSPGLVKRNGPACSTAYDCGTPGKLICCPNPPLKDPPHPSSTSTALPTPTVSKRDAEAEPQGNFVCRPPSFGCGTKLAPKCCFPDGYQPPKEKRDAEAVAEPQGNFVCVPPTYGCGTKLAPRCCYPDGYSAPPPKEKREAEPEAKAEAIPVPGPGPVCIPPTYGCGTKLKPKCCQPTGYPSKKQ